MNNRYTEILKTDKCVRGKLSIYNYPAFSLVRAKRLCERYKKYKPFYILLWLIYRHKEIKYGCDIPAQTAIGKGFKIEHANGIVINPESIIGEYCTILNGALIGNERRGKRLGTPTIGNKVYIGSYATIVGNIRIGNDVMIAPGSFVNFDVPDHSVVVGNPGKIFFRENATMGYICTDD